MEKGLINALFVSKLRICIESFHANLHRKFVSRSSVYLAKRDKKID